MTEQSGLLAQSTSADVSCRHCGGTSFFVNVEVRGDAWCDAIVTLDGHHPKVEADGFPRDADLEVEWIDEVGCGGCDKRVPRSCIADLIGPRYEPQVGERVTLPDGLDAVIEAVLPARWKSNIERDPRIWVLAGGREWSSTDLAPIRPNPNQLHLLEAA